MPRFLGLGMLTLAWCLALGPVGHAEVYTVDRLTDAGEGAGLTGDLRYCITQATSGLDTITFAVTGTINLTRALPDLATSVTLAGPGAEQLTVRRASGGDYRIFTLTGTPTVVISDLTVANGQARLGGGIYVADGHLILSDSILSNNGAFLFPEPGFGGGIYVAGGRVEVRQSTFSANQARGSQYACSIADGRGGGLYVAGGTVFVHDSTLSNNQATGSDGCIGGDGGSGLGGGLYVAGGTVQVFQNTLSGNRSTGGMAGYLAGRGGNGLGGGLFVSGGVVEVRHSTFSANQAIGGAGVPDYRAGEGRGGGLVFTTGTLRTRNTILAGNRAQTAAPDLFGNLGSLGYNLIGNSAGGSGFDETDLLNVDPKLGPLQDNGGLTWTHALLEGSPAIDAGDNEDAPKYDQRGEGFPRIVADLIDIGAFEVQKAAAATGRSPGNRALK